MLITVARDEDMPGVIAQLRIINELRGQPRDGAPYDHHRAVLSPWVRTMAANPRYL